MGDEVKSLIEAQGRAFEAFKKTNDEILARKADGQGVAELESKLKRIEAELSQGQETLRRLGEVEAKLGKMELGTGGAGRDPKKSEYRAALASWLRTGNGEEQLRGLAPRASLTAGSDPDGGFLLTEELEAGIDRVLPLQGAVRRLSRVLRIGAASYKKLVTKSGAAGGWVEETGARPETAGPQLSQLEFVPKEVYALPYATQTLLDDSSVDIERWLAEEVGITFGEKEGAAFISGNGVISPRGILAYDAVLKASWEWGKLEYVKSGNASGFPTAAPGDVLIDLQTALKGGYRQGSVFLMNRVTEAVIRKFKNATTEEYFWQPSLQAGVPATLLGHAVEIDDNMPDVAANAFPIAFGNFQRGYLVVDRVGVRVLRDPYTNKPYVGFYSTRRVGGGVQNFEAIKLLKIAA